MTPSSFWPNHPHSACRADNFSSRPRWVCLVRGVRAKSYCPQVNNSALDSRPSLSPRGLDRDRRATTLDQRHGLIARPGDTGGSDPLPPFRWTIAKIVQRALFPSRGLVLDQVPAQRPRPSHENRSVIRAAMRRCTMPTRPAQELRSTIGPTIHLWPPAIAAPSIRSLWTLQAPSTTL